MLVKVLSFCENFRAIKSIRTSEHTFAIMAIITLVAFLTLSWVKGAALDTIGVTVISWWWDLGIDLNC
jgi:hypothetical protein